MFKCIFCCPDCQFAKVNFINQSIPDVITRGIEDEEIRLDILEEKNQSKSLEETITYIKAKESSKKATCWTTTATTSGYKKNASQLLLIKK